jgi:hypothetical protein
MSTRRGLCLLLPVWFVIATADQALPPRSSADDYPAHQSAPNVSIGAIRVRPDQVSKMFSADIAKNYAVVEVALYPQNGATVDVRLFDFGLRFGGEQETRPDTPEQASVPWRENRRVQERVQTTEEVGVFVGTGTDPVTGRRTTSTGTYERVGVGVGTSPDQRFPDPPRGADSRILEDKLAAKELPEGKTGRAVAGYLYFPQPTKKLKDAKLELTYSKDGTSVALSLPAK